MDKWQDIKKRVVMDANLKYGGVALYVHDHEGQMWATNKIWATPAYRVAPLLEKYNLPADKPGVYAVGQDVKVGDGVIPSGLPAELADESLYFPAMRVEVAGEPAFIRSSTGVLFTVWALADGSYAGLRADEETWLRESYAYRHDPDVHISGPVQVLFRKSKAEGSDMTRVAALFRVSLTRTLEPHRYGTDPETKEQVSIPAVTEPAGTMVTGILAGWLVKP